MSDRIAHWITAHAEWVVTTALLVIGAVCFAVVMGWLVGPLKLLAMAAMLLAIMTIPLVEVISFSTMTRDACRSLIESLESTLHGKAPS